MIEDSWAETDDSIVQCLRERGAMSPADLALQLGISLGEATAFICLLVGEGRVKLRLVEAADSPEFDATPRRGRREHFGKPALAPVPAGDW